MTFDRRSDYVSRTAILNMLTPDELIKVSNAELTDLKRGDEYLDLSHLTLGVRTVEGKPRSAKNALLRSAVRSETWSKVMALLATP